MKPEFVEVAADKSKTRRRRLVPILPTLRSWLDLQGDLPVLNLVRRLRRVRAAAGIPWPHDCLRHSFCSYVLPVKGAAWTANAAGHSEQILFQHYWELVPPAEAERFWALRPAA